MGQALKAYDKVTTSYKDSAVYGYATYKKGWCYFNLDDKERALDLFLATLNFAKKRSDLPNAKPLIKQSRKDIVMTYAYVGAASKAIPFFRKITDDEQRAIRRNVPLSPECLHILHTLNVFDGQRIANRKLRTELTLRMQTS